MASLHTSVEANRERSTAGTITTGLLARWDVLRWVPFAGAGVGAYHFSGTNPNIEGYRFGVPLKAGLEFLLSRNWMVSVQLSGHVVVRTETAELDWAQLTVGIGPTWDF